MVGSRISCSAEEAQPPSHHARTSHLQSMCDAGPIRSMGPVSLLKVKPAAVTCVLTSQWAIEIARGPEHFCPVVNSAPKRRRSLVEEESTHVVVFRDTTLAERIVRLSDLLNARLRRLIAFV